jgi:hypothetical protein
MPSIHQEKHLMTTDIRFDDNFGDLTYPFLPVTWQWHITPRKNGNEEVMQTIYDAPTPTLRWVKDDKVLDLYIPNMDTAGFLQATGLQLSLKKGGFVLSKRLSRILRPYRYWQFYNENSLNIHYGAKPVGVGQTNGAKVGLLSLVKRKSRELDPDLWDGCGLVSRAYIERLASELDLSDRHRRELIQTQRFEVTCLHADGQDKGHVLVTDDLTPDFLFPAGSAKTEIALTNGQIFVGLQPIHSRDEMRLDVQSLINLHPFFSPEQLLVWLQQESELFLERIQNGDIADLMGRIYNLESAAELASLSNWHVGEYLASGGLPMWFAAICKAIAKQHLNRLRSQEEKLRCPVPGARYYIFPSAVGQREVPSGYVELDPDTATAWVNYEDWLNYIVDILGGCDGDDALWCFPFEDVVDNECKILLWRSPNQLGEYVVLKPTEKCHTIEWQLPQNKSLSYPKMNSRLLPPRIDSCHYQYGELSEASDQTLVSQTEYSIGAMLSSIQQAARNVGLLGATCNVMMLCKALYNKLPEKMPASLETIIDASVKTGEDLTPVRVWTRKAGAAIIKQRKPVPDCLADRLRPLVNGSLQRKIRLSQHHWLDALTRAVDRHCERYWADVEALAVEACPPLAVFEQGRDWLHVGKDFRQCYSQVIRKALDVDGEVTPEDLEEARHQSETFLHQYPADKQACVLLGATCYLYAQGSQKGEAVRDSVLWQLGMAKTGEESGREAGIAQQMVQALRDICLLGEPVWTTEGAVLFYRPDEPCLRCAGIPVTFNGVWFNWLRATQPKMPAKMGQIPLALRQQAKDRISQYAQKQFVGMTLTTSVAENNRVITYTPQGNLFGYVHRDHELLAVRKSQWQVAWAMAVDGNVRAILTTA